MIIGKKVILEIPEEKHLSKMLEWRNDPEFRQYYREYRVLSYENQLKWWKDKILNDDKKAIFQASTLAQKAFDFLEGLQEEEKKVA